MKAAYLGWLSGAAAPALCTAAYSEAKHIAVLESVAVQVQHPAYGQAIFPSRLQAEQHTISTVT